MSVALDRIPCIEDAYLYGSFAKNEEYGSSDIDLLILGHPDSLKLAAGISALDKTLKREVNYTVLKPSELKRRLEAHDPFLTDVWQGRKVELIGDGQDKIAAN